MSSLTVGPAVHTGLLTCGEVLVENAQTSCSDETQTSTLDISYIVSTSCKVSYSKLPWN